ncbi:MAG TPA: GNAT family N-acetyltransferase [Propionibacteriaceae bacterium]|nr:GNAT family N-acetyltransferase [Propionibacteriaceae bacterium]
MALARVKPDDLDQVAAVVDILNAARRIDDPESWPDLVELMTGELAYGWDLEPPEQFLYTPDGADSPVASLSVDLPQRDNRHLVGAWIVVHPDHRRLGHGSNLMAEVLRIAAEAGRPTIWVQAVEADQGARTFVERFGFVYASHDARRRQVLAEVDPEVIDNLYATAERAAADYRLERLVQPIADEVLTELIEATAAINDAPMGDLTFEHEVFDLARLQDSETARRRRGERSYRVIARHRETGEIGGHTMVVTHPLRPAVAGQADTAVARAHRGHRLGLLLKIDMMRWLAEVEPQIEVIDTWNNVDNDFMIKVNEALGYRLSQVFATYELNQATQRRD